MNTPPAKVSIMNLNGYEFLFRVEIDTDDESFIGITTYRLDVDLAQYPSIPTSTLYFDVEIGCPL